MASTFVQSTPAPSAREICKVGVLVTVLLGGTVIGPKIEDVHRGPAAASEFVIGVPHEDLDHGDASWPIQVTKELSETSTPATLVLPEGISTAETVVGAAM